MIQRTRQVRKMFEMYNDYNNLNVFLKEQKNPNWEIIKEIFNNIKRNTKQIQDQEQRLLESNLTVVHDESTLHRSYSRKGPFPRTR